MNKQKLAILGSTGSIGTQTLEIVRQHPDKFEVTVLSANTNVELLAQQVNEFNPECALICKDILFKNLKELVKTESELISGEEHLSRLATHAKVDTVVNSLVGFSGFHPTIEAIKAGKKIALANKESLVVGGELIFESLKNSTSTLIPVDSEHSAMLQCLVGEPKGSLEKIIITASGGPFRTFSVDQMRSVTKAQALKHPNWNMGAKITIDSATMMNKGLEIIEAHWLFDIPVYKIEPVIHPQSIIHSIVTFKDGSSKAQLGLPDMKVPIIYALSYPDRLDLETPRMDWTKKQDLTFEPVDYLRFPCVKLAIDAIEEGGVTPTVLNAANEVAVQRFLNEEIGYIDISKVVEKSMQNIPNQGDISIELLKEIDKETRAFASTI
ncbi:MAG: 1-deoxy-D-xylulose-5-phosphate reductoisomerase [Balneola sp.]|nr:MAG: 1-deoxy-D-xylulose-5-phosphate reductoisomerase [Balneola sp.]